jgi:hypothetical protein
MANPEVDVANVTGPKNPDAAASVSVKVELVAGVVNPVVGDP